MLILISVDQFEVIPERHEVPDPESRNKLRAFIWIPGSRFQRARN